MKIKYSALVSDARGKLNGSVASRNRYGQYFRNKVSPINRNTPAQQAVRGVFGTISSQWRTLSEELRNAWAGRAMQKDFIDQFGDAHTLQPNAYFIKANMLTRLNGLGAAVVDVIDYVFSGEGFIAEVEASNVPIRLSDMRVANWNQAQSNSKINAVLFATPSMSPGRKFVKNDYRKVAVLTVDQSSDNPVDVGSSLAEWADHDNEYGAIFGTPTAGQIVGLKLVFVTGAGTAHVVNEAIVTVGA